MVLISLAKLLLIYNIVHAYINTLLLVIFKYRTAENFQGRKLSRILRFCAYSRKFSLQNLGAWCPLARHERAICESFLCKKRISPICKSFLPRKFPAIRYFLTHYLACATTIVCGYLLERTTQMVSTSFSLRATFRAPSRSQLPPPCSREDSHWCASVEHL